VPRRAPFAVLVLPYAVALDGVVSYAVFREPALSHRTWHLLAAHALRAETPLEAARRAAWQIAEVPPDAAYLALDTRSTIELQGAPSELAAHAFAVRVCTDEVCPRRRHVEHHWVSYRIADGLLHNQADRDALWELRRRLGPATCC
jgi:hypothetical protein